MYSANQGDLILMLAKLLVAVCFLIFVGLVFEENFRTLCSTPRYTKEELIAKTEKRKMLLDRERLHDLDLVKDGIHVQTGLINDANLKLVIQNCTSCHSAKLITQNRSTREGWRDMIRWMQATQGLMDLGIHEPRILDYLSTHYAPQKIGRRQNLNVQEIEWYILNLDKM